LAAQIGGSFWRLILASHFGVSIWRVLLANVFQHSGIGGMQQFIFNEATVEGRLLA
jgi:hypothetical protein